MIKINYLEQHQKRVAALTGQIAIVMCPGKYNIAVKAALMHDVGKYNISRRILMKPSKLNDREWLVMQRHPVVGAGLVLTTGTSNEIAMAIRHHHERWDGNGYPDHLKGEKIPLLSRVLAVADAFDAMVSNRPYRKAMSVYDALAEIQNCAGTQFDLDVVCAFSEIIEKITWEGSLL